MARDFDGTDDYLNLGSDASVDDFSAITFCCWIQFDTDGNFNTIFFKTDSATENSGPQIHRNTFMTKELYIARSYSTSFGEWQTTEVMNNGVRYHAAVTHDGTTGAPVFYLNGPATPSTLTAPVGTLKADAANDIYMGSRPSLISEVDGRMQHVVYHNAVLTAAEINRAMWWGRPFGGLKVYHPLITSKLANEGSATADATATGTTTASFATPVQRPGAALMGMGCGW